MEIKKYVPEFAERIYKHFKQQAILRAVNEKLPVKIYSTPTYRKISFCITCMNRLHQLRRTIKKNISDNERYPDAEFVIINYNSTDGLDQWVRENLNEQIKSGRVKYFYTREPKGWSAAHAKNLAHFMSTGDIVCNLDGDNFTGKDFAFYINYLFDENKDGDLLLQFRKKKYFGTYGRICMKRKSFEALGGYDEDLYAVGGEDMDLLERGRAYGLDFRLIQKENFLKYIENTNRDRVKNTGLENSFAYYNKINYKRTKERVANNDLKANAGKVKKVKLRNSFETEWKEVVYLDPKKNSQKAAS